MIWWLARRGRAVARLASLGGGRRGGRISVIDAGGATVAVIAGLDGYSITDLAADPEGNRVTPPRHRSGCLARHDHRQPIDVGGHPEALAVSSDGHRLYVGDYWSGTVTVFSVQP